MIADFVENGGDLKEDGVVIREVMEIAGAVENLIGEMGDVAGMAHVAAELTSGEFGGVEELAFQFLVGSGRVGEVGEEAFLVVGARDAEGGEFEGLGDGGIDDEGREGGACRLVIEVEFFDALGLGESGDVGGELAEDVVAGFGFVGLGKVGCEHLDLGADHDEVFDLFIAEIVVDLRDETGDLFADEADDGFAGEVGGVEAFPAAVGAEAVRLVADNAAFFGEDEAGIAGAHVRNNGVALLHRGGVAETAAGFEENEAGHLAIVERFEAPLAGDLEAVEEDLGIGGLIESVGGDCADGDVAEAEFIEGVLEAPDDLDGLLDGGGLDLSVAEDVAPERDVFLEEIQAFAAAVFANLDDDHGGMAGADVNGGAERFGRTSGHG